MLRISPNYPVCHSIKNKDSNKNFSTQNQGYSINNSENPFGILGFAGKEINIAQTRVFNSYSPEIYRLIDFLCPPNLKIRDNEYIILRKNEKDFNLIFNPLKCNSDEERYKLFSIGLNVALKRAQEEENSRVFIEINDPDGMQYLQRLGFKTSDAVNDNDKTTIVLSKKSFPRTLKKIENLIQKICRDNTKFKSNVISLPDFSSQPIVISPEGGEIGQNDPAMKDLQVALLKEEDKIVIKDLSNSSNIQVRINGQSPLNPQESSEIKPGDTLKLGNEVYLFDKGNNYELRFLVRDEQNDFNKLFPSGIKNIDFFQTIGDCYFLSALKSLSKNTESAELIAKMIEPIPDGGYKVTFPSFPKESLDISKEEIEEIKNAKDSVKTDHLGVKILEHAYYKLRKKADAMLGPEHPVFARLKTKPILLNFGDVGEALHVLTGKKTLYFSTEKLDAKKAKDLFKSLKINNLPTIALTGKSISSQGTMNKELHVYSVSEINPEKEEVTIINPDDSSKESKISYKTFIENFTYISCVDLKSR